MHNADEFRVFSDACIVQANELWLSRTQRETLLRMAAKWLALAQEAERIRNLMGEAMESAAAASKVPTSSKVH
jgi:hypothetical protein